MSSLEAAVQRLVYFLIRVVCFSDSSNMVIGRTVAHTICPRYYSYQLGAKVLAQSLINFHKINFIQN